MSQLFFLKHNRDYVIILRSTPLYAIIEDDVFGILGEIDKGHTGIYPGRQWVEKPN
jgi:hypothetical protein